MKNHKADSTRAGAARACGGETRTRVRALTAGQAAALLGLVSPDTPLFGVVGDSRGREVQAGEVVVEVATYERSPHLAWLTLMVPSVAPADVCRADPEEPFVAAWLDHELGGGCPLAAVTALLARRSCTPLGCRSYGSDGCAAAGPIEDWDPENWDPDQDLV